MAESAPTEAHTQLPAPKLDTPKVTEARLEERKRQLPRDRTT